MVNVSLKVPAKKRLYRSLQKLSFPTFLSLASQAPIPSHTLLSSFDIMAGVRFFNSTLNALSLAQTPSLCLKCTRRVNYTLVNSIVEQQHNFSSHHRLLNPRSKESPQYEVSTSATVKRARGRPRKTALVEEDGVKSASEEKPKRKRGRPKKTEILSHDEANLISEEQSMAQNRIPEETATPSTIKLEDSTIDDKSLSSNITLSETNESTETTTPRQKKSPSKSKTREPNSYTLKFGRSLPPQAPIPSYKSKKEHWQRRKASIAAKNLSQPWNPKSKLSPDTMAAIRTLNEQYPEQFTLQVLRDHFDISHEGLRRILKSRWAPSEQEEEARRKRWEERGKAIWEKLADQGSKPPKKWREMGVGKAKEGEDGVPRWKRTEWRKKSLWWEKEVVGKALGGEVKKQRDIDVRPS
jgi:Neugrin